MSSDLIISVTVPTRTAEEFATFARQASRLKAFGQVQMAVSSLSGKAFHDVPPGGSAWHEYTTCLASLEKFYPHPMLQEFVDRAYVERNRQLLRACLPILREMQLGASFHIHAPWYLPEGFFEKYPRLRGPRVDHPRRGRREEFAICIDLPEGQAFYERMVADLVKDVPELGSMTVSTNDAGGGFCWADWLYSGPNGPDHCRYKDPGRRVRDLVDTINRGAGKTLDIHVRANWSSYEHHLLQHQIDDHTFFSPRQAPDPRLISTGTFVDNPVIGMIDAVGLVKTLERLKTGKVRKIGLNFGTNYARSHDLPEAAEKVIEIVEAYLRQPVQGTLRRLNFLRGLCVKWAGEQQADALLEALITFHEALTYKNTAIRSFTGNYCGVSVRHITRPLVPVPESLTIEEESYFLPHVFNIHEAEARSDYIDVHGGRIHAPDMEMPVDGSTSRPTDRFRSMLNDAAKAMENLDGPDTDVWRRMGLSLRIYGCVIRSVGNFYSAQLARDRNLDKLSAPQPIPPKKADWYGDADLQRLNHAMRHELNNTLELIELLESGGLKQVALAPTPQEEDTFFLGPDLVDQLRKKCRIMRRHWIEGQKHLVIPHK